MKRPLSILTGTLLLLSQASQICALEFQLPANKRDYEYHSPLINEIRQQGGPQLKTRFDVKATPVSASLSVYAIPFEGWCSNGETGNTTQGRVTVAVNFPRAADGNRYPATIAVHVGSRSIYNPTTLGAGRFSLTSDVFTLSRDEICSTRCVEYSLHPRGTTPAYMIDTSRHQACIN